LKSLQEAIRRKHPGVLSNGVILIHDVAIPHMAQQTLNLLQKLSSESVNCPYGVFIWHQEIFIALKENVSGHCLTFSEDVKHAQIM
jgi:hypothetical protein